MADEDATPTPAQSVTGFIPLLPDSLFPSILPPVRVHSKLFGIALLPFSLTSVARPLTWTSRRSSLGPGAGFREGHTLPTDSLQRSQPTDSRWRDLLTCRLQPSRPASASTRVLLRCHHTITISTDTEEDLDQVSIRTAFLRGFHKATDHKDFTCTSVTAAACRGRYNC